MKPPVNIHGRRGGRGLRPYLLVAKLVCVAAFLGGLLSLLAGVLISGTPASVETHRAGVEIMRQIYRRVVIPGAAGAMLMGFTLLASVWRPLLRMRWLQVKLVLLGVGIPACHLFLSNRCMALAGEPAPATAHHLRAQLAIGTAAALFLGIAVMILGRIKPRLGRKPQFTPTVKVSGKP